MPHHWATGGESLWATDLGGDRFRLENVPFYAYDLNFHDIVEAKAAAPDLKPSILRVVHRSGHRTMRVIFAENVPEQDRLERLRSLRRLNVWFERCNRHYFALDLEPEAEADVIEAELREWVGDGVAEYETCEARALDSFDDVPESERSV